MSRKKIQDGARRYLGVPFVHQGRSEHGLDCVGLLVRLAQDLGLDLPDYTTYDLRPHPKLLVQRLELTCERVEEAEPGDILVFAMIGPGWPQHAAIRTDRGMIHALRDVGRVVEHVYDSTWKDRLDSAWRFRWQPS